MERALWKTFPSIKSKKIKGLREGRWGHVLPLRDIPEFGLDYYSGVQYTIVLFEDYPDRYDLPMHFKLEDVVHDMASGSDTAQTSMKGFCESMRMYGYAFLEVSDKQLNDTQSLFSSSQSFFDFDQKIKCQHAVRLKKHGPRWTQGWTWEWLREYIEFRDTGLDINGRFPEPLRTDLKNVYDTYYEISVQLLRALCEGAHLDADTIAKKLESRPPKEGWTNATMYRMYRYWKITDLVFYKRWFSSTSEYAPHNDLGLITLSPASDLKSGLVVHNFVTGWQDVEKDIKPNELIVFCGQALSVITDSYYAPLSHRVSISQTKRHSMPFFLRLPPNELLTTVHFEGEPPRNITGFNVEKWSSYRLFMRKWTHPILRYMRFKVMPEITNKING